jgi:hypothetical protein
MSLLNSISCSFEINGIWFRRLYAVMI